MKKIIITVLAVAASCAASAQAADPIAVLNAAGGRFVFGQISARHSDDFMLDTQTGRLWRITCFDESLAPGAICHDIRLAPVPYAAPQAKDVSLTDLSPWGSSSTAPVKK